MIEKMVKRKELFIGEIGDVWVLWLDLDFCPHSRAYGLKAYLELCSCQLYMPPPPPQPKYHMLSYIHVFRYSQSYRPDFVFAQLLSWEECSILCLCNCFPGKTVQGFHHVLKGSSPEIWGARPEVNVRHKVNCARGWLLASAC